MTAWRQLSFDGDNEPEYVLPERRRSRRPKGTAKGNPFAQKVAEFLGTERRVLNGRQDKGDLVLRTITAEVKCTGRGQPLRLSEWMNEAKVEGKNAGTPSRYCVISRRTGYPVGEAFVTMPLWMAVELGIIE